MSCFTKIGLAIAAVLCTIALVFATSPDALDLSFIGTLLSGGAFLATSFSGGYGVRDNNYKLTLALPNAASTTVNTTTGLDTEVSSIGDFLAKAELLITAPALNTTILPDTKTMTYNVIASANSNMAGAVVVGQNALVQTGAGGAGAAAATGRWRPPTNIGATGRYLGLQEVSGANTTDASSKSGTLEMLF
jgi:hypothetical protein